jgi:hypothetical protein
VDTFQYPSEDGEGRATGTFQYPVPRPAKKMVLPHSTGARESDEPAGGFFIQGISASSREWIVYQALRAVGWPEEDIEFQVGFLGGRHFKGGIIVDFVLNTQPLPTPIFVHGDYWHQGLAAAEDMLEVYRLMDHMAGRINLPVILYGMDISSFERARWAIVDKLGRP